MTSEFVHKSKANPVIVWYECEFCHDGEQKFNPHVESYKPGLFTHTCDKCGKTMLLPTMYPYVDWQKGEEIKEDSNETA